MNQEENQQPEGNWGLPRGLYTQVKYYGIPIMKAFIIVGSFVFPLQFRDLLFPRGQGIEVPTQFNLYNDFNDLLDDPNSIWW